MEEKYSDELVKSNLLGTTLGEEVTWANLQTPFFAPGIGNLKETLAAGSAGVDANLKMHVEGNFLRVYMKGKKLGIPLANVKTVVFK